MQLLREYFRVSEQFHYTQVNLKSSTLFSHFGWQVCTERTPGILDKSTLYFLHNLWLPNTLALSANKSGVTSFFSNNQKFFPVINIEFHVVEQTLTCVRQHLLKTSLHVLLKDSLMWPLQLWICPWFYHTASSDLAIQFNTAMLMKPQKAHEKWIPSSLKHFKSL